MTFHAKPTPKGALWKQMPQYATKTPPSAIHGSKNTIVARKSVRKLSQKRAAQLMDYMKLKKRLYGLPCQAKCGVIGCNLPMKDNHHSRGRSGRLFLAPEWFIPVCRPHHNLCKDKPEEARHIQAVNPIGVLIPLLCAKGDWGKYEIPRENKYEYENKS